MRHPDLTSLSEWEHQLQAATLDEQWPDVVQLVLQGWQAHHPATPVALYALISALNVLGAGVTSGQVLKYAQLLFPAAPVWKNLLTQVPAEQKPDTCLKTFLQWWQNLQRKPSVALAMIVRDEATAILPCLQSVMPLVDEAWILDTGSTDGTPDLIRTHFPSIQIEAFSWSEDFALVRNVLIERVHSDWILMVDGDEILESQGQHTLRQLLAWQPLGLSVYGLKVGTSLSTTSWMRRLFPRHPALRFHGRIHEQLIRLDGHWLWQHNLESVWLCNRVARSPARHAWSRQQELQILQQCLTDPLQNNPYVRYQYAMAAWQHHLLTDQELVNWLSSALNDTLNHIYHPPNLTWQGVPIEQVKMLLSQLKAR